jgi:hypothetical protein
MVNSNIFLGSGASTVLVPEHDLAISNVAQDTANANILHFTDFATTYELVTNLYIGCEFEIYNDTNDTLISTHTIKSNTGNTLTSSSTVAAFATDKRHRIIIKGYGSPSPSKPDSSNQRLNADNWIGIAETITFPTLEQELKQMNLGLGGTRNFSYQYKGIRTASGGSLALTANNGSWLYYALGGINNITYTSGAGTIAEITTASTNVVLPATFDTADAIIALDNATDLDKLVIGMTVTSTGISSAQTIIAIDYDNNAITLSDVPDIAGTNENVTFAIPAANRELFLASGNDLVFVHDSDGNDSLSGQVSTDADIVNTGPIMYRTVNGSNEILPPYNPILYPTASQMNQVNTGEMITYTIEEGNTSDLPSFSLEQSLSKDPSVLTTNASYDANAVEDAVNQESQSFTRIARGNRVNSLTIEAAEGEEVKFNVDINSRLVDSITDIYHKGGIAPTYEARNGVSINDNLFNWNAGTNSGAPFFFSSGSLEAFGQQFLKVSSVSIEIQNNLQDKRYMGGHRDMKEGLAAQRAYVITFSAIVTDDEIFRYYLNEAETVGTGSSQLIKLRFDKEDNEEFIDLQFKNYFLDTANWTIPDDKGPVTIEATIKPRDLHSCTIGTDWVILG